MSDPRSWLGSCVLSLLLAAMPAMALENRLAGNPSPYLALHGGDPVHWQPWGPEILELARREGKLIFISSGYFACHWCHVMQRESFSDAAIARLLNEGFIPVKVDRELEQALDAHLIAFVEQTQGQAGWPLNVFLTPEGYPLLGTTYMPPDSFAGLLQRLGAMWSSEADAARDLARRALLELQAQRSGGSGGSGVTAPPPEQLAQRLAQESFAISDEMLGGFGQQSRFPMVPQLEALLELQRRWPQPRLADFLRLTLDQMARRGLRDHISGGFFRYTVDPDWLIPHYEKMLYSQAQLAELYLRAAEPLQRPQYLAVARDTLDFVLRDMRGSGGAFIASLSAVDDKGIEGGHYLWTRAEFTAPLEASQQALALAHWGLADLSEQASRLPLLAAEAGALATLFDQPQSKIEAILAAARERLQQAAGRRSLPRDHKELLGWNGLLLSALSLAGQRFGEPYAEAARQLAAGLRRQFRDGDGWVRARAPDGSMLGTADIEDYAYLAQGLASLAALTGSVTDREAADEVLTAAWRLFWQDGRWRVSAQPVLPGMASVTALEDGALPSASAMLIQLSLASERAELREAAALANLAAWPAVEAGGLFWYPGHLRNLLGPP